MGPLPGFEPGTDDYKSTVLPLNYSGMNSIKNIFDLTSGTQQSREYESNQ